MSPTAPQPPSIVVAEDDDALREMLAECFRALGYRVREVEDGQELLGALQEAHETGQLPNLVVSDQRMPRLSGLEVLSWMGREASPSVPFVLLSAYAAPQLRDSARRLGAALVLDKPIDLKRLREFVVGLLGPVEPGFTRDLG